MFSPSHLSLRGSKTFSSRLHLDLVKMFQCCSSQSQRTMAYPVWDSRQSQCIVSAHVQLQGTMLSPLSSSNQPKCHMSRLTSDRSQSQRTTSCPVSNSSQWQGSASCQVLDSSQSQRTVLCPVWDSRLLLARSLLGHFIPGHWMSEHHFSPDVIRRSLNALHTHTTQSVFLSRYLANFQSQMS